MQKQNPPKSETQVYLDLALCPQALRTDRAIGDKSALCSDPRPLGRLVIGLYGDTAPGCVAAFTSLLGSGAYTGTTVNKIYPGRYIKAGKQGSRRYGEVDAVQLEMQDPAPANPDLVRPRLDHAYPVCISAHRPSSSSTHTPISHGCTRQDMCPV